MTTKEFCDTYHIPHPVFTGEVKSSADLILQVDAIKQRMFVEYAKFLNKPLSLDLFIGNSKVFENFEVTSNFENKPVLRIIGQSQVYAYINDDGFSMNYPSMAKKIEDLVSLGLQYHVR